MSDNKETRAKRPIPASSPPERANEGREEAPGQTPAIEVELVAPAAALPPPSPRTAVQTSENIFADLRGTFAALAERQFTVASGVKALALEMSGLARSNLIAAAENASALAGTRSLAEAMEVQFTFVRSSLDTMAAGSKRLSEIGASLVTEVSRPIVAPGTDSNRIR